MEIFLFCISKPNLLFESPPFVPLSEPRALSAGCLPGKRGGGREGIWPSARLFEYFIKWARGGGIKKGENERGMTWREVIGQ